VACSKRDIVAADASAVPPIERQTLSAEFEHWSVAQTVRIIAVFVAAADLVDALGQQGPLVNA